MTNHSLKIIYLGSLTLLFASCSGVKVIHSNAKNKNAGTMSLDENGKRVSAIGKTEDGSRNEALAKCREQTFLSTCLPKNAICVRN